MFITEFKLPAYQVHERLSRREASQPEDYLSLAFISAKHLKQAHASQISERLSLSIKDDIIFPKDYLVKVSGIIHRLRANDQGSQPIS